MSDTTPALGADVAAFAPDPGLMRVSRELIRTLQDPSGAYPASPTFSAYQGHSWFRDGAFIAEGARRSGDADGSARFHSWCASVVNARSVHITDIVARSAAGTPVGVAEMLPTRYTLDGRDGTDAWWDFQLDGYGTWLWALAEHTAVSGLPDPACLPAAILVVDYLAAFWDRPCYDWWEEHVEHRHLSTLGAVRAGLDCALRSPVLTAALPPASVAGASAAIASLDQVVLDEGLSTAPRASATSRHLVKWKGSDLVDASLLACVEPFAVPLPTGVAEATIDAVEADLAVEGGVHRYLLDTYFGGGQWLLLSAFLAWSRIGQGRLDDAGRYLAWIESQAGPDGFMPEQVNGHLLAPEREQEWIDKWGTSASPLLWSHAMYLIASDAYVSAHARKPVTDTHEVVA